MILIIYSQRQNYFGGTLPESLTNLVNLVALDISLNEMTGYLPDFESDTLILFTVRKNRFKGTIPRDIGKINITFIERFENS